MKRPPLCHLLLAAAWGALVPPLAADEHVAVNAYAEDEYTQGKFINGQTRIETYVFMQGKYFEGATADRSIEKMSFRSIAEYLAPELAKQRFLPCKDPAAADLLLLVHWGTTIPRVTADEFRAVTTTNLDTSQEKAMQEGFATDMIGVSAGLGPLLTTTGTEADRAVGYDQLDDLTDRLDEQFQSGSNAKLLGYTRELNRLSRDMVSGAVEATLRSDLAGERYFIIVRAYDLKKRSEPGRPRRPVWTIYLNIRSPGHNFQTALNLMGTAGADYFGRATDGVRTTKVSTRPGKVTLAPVVILGEQK